MLKRFEDFVGIISSIYKNIQKVKKNKMKEFGLSGNHVMSLFYLSRNAEGLTAAQLCQLISVDKAATSRVLAELLEKGYVYYPELEGGKKYRTTVMLTEKGKKVTEEFDGIICSVVQEIGGNLSEEERDNMYHALDLISNNLEKMANSQ
ncbi:MAG: MarR family transcriptional regulator [Tyzzerella sp.]|nr:MarR family transcriptional regulator [Tyzzerella sp.]